MNNKKENIKLVNVPHHPSRQGQQTQKGQKAKGGAVETKPRGERAGIGWMRSLGFIFFQRCYDCAWIVVPAYILGQIIFWSLMGILAGYLGHLLFQLTNSLF